MTRTPDEIKKGLEEEIPVHYHIDGEPRLTPRLLMDMQWLHKDALALIQQLQAENAEKAETIMWMEAERDDLKRYIQQLEAQNAEKAERIRMLCADIEEAKKKLDCWHDKLDVKIDKVEAGIVDLIQYCNQLQAERDAAVRDIKQMVHDPYEPCFCDYCKLTEEECAKSNCRGRNAFEWRGVQKEE